MQRDEYALYCAVIEAGSLSEAARRLHASPAMISKRLSALEARLGTQLVHRTTRRFEVTPEGRAFYEDVRGILAAARDAEERISGAVSVPVGRLRVSVPTSFGRLFLAPVISEFARTHPQVTLEVDLSDRMLDAQGEQVDLALRIAPKLPSHLDARRIGASHRVLCAAPRYLAAEGAPMDLAALKRHRLLAAEGQLPWQLTGPEGPARFDGRSAIRTNSSEFVRELTLCGEGVALRSVWDVADALTDGRLVRVLPDYGGSADVAIYAVWPRASLVPAAVKALTDLLEARLAPMLEALPAAPA